MGHVVLCRIAISAFHGVQVTSSDLVPKRARDLAVAKLAQHLKGSMAVTVTVAMASRLLARGLVEDVVVSSLDRCGRQDGIELVALGMLVGPFLDGLEHFPLKFNMVVAECRVVERLEDVIDNFIDRNARVFPCVENTTKGTTLLAKELFEVGYWE